MVRAVPGGGPPTRPSACTGSVVPSPPSPAGARTCPKHWCGNTWPTPAWPCSASSAPPDGPRTRRRTWTTRPARRRTTSSPPVHCSHSPRLVVLAHGAQGATWTSGDAEAAATRRARVRTATHPRPTGSSHTDTTRPMSRRTVLRALAAVPAVALLYRPPARHLPLPLPRTPRLCRPRRRGCSSRARRGSRQAPLCSRGLGSLGGATRHPFAAVASVVVRGAGRGRGGAVTRRIGARTEATRSLLRRVWRGLLA
jgi:hypothetical protein